MPDLLRPRATQSGVELFAAYGIGLIPASAEAERGALADVTFLSVAGFSGSHFSGFVVLGTTEGMLRRSNVTASSSSDWMAELGNQLLGRIKNRLLTEGISIRRVPPARVTGTARLLFDPRTGARPVVLTDGEDSVVIWAESEPSVEATVPSLPSDTAVLVEGEVLLF